MIDLKRKGKMKMCKEEKKKKRRVDGWKSDSHLVVVVFVLFHLLLIDFEKLGEISLKLV